MKDVDDSDYHYLLHLFSEVEKGDDYMDGADFIKQFLSADDLKILEERLTI